MLPPHPNPHTVLRPETVFFSQSPDYRCANMLEFPSRVHLKVKTANGLARLPRPLQPKPSRDSLAQQQT